MANLLVTGGAGFIGANFVRHWRQRRPDDAIIIVDALTYAGSRSNLDGVSDVPLFVEDIRNTPAIRALLARYRIDTIVNFAAESHVDRSIDGPDAFIDTNIVGTHSLLKAAKAVWLDEGSGQPHRFHHVSTDEVYGSLGPHDRAFTETTPFAPNSPYSASKAASDHLVRAYQRTYGLETSISHCSNNYGPYQLPEKLIPLFVVNCLRGIDLPIYGDGMNVRDWLHVDDHCRGIERILLSGRPGQTYNIGGGEELPNLAVVNAVCAGIDAAFEADPSLASRFPDAPAAQGRASECLKRHVADRLGHDRRYAVDDGKIRKELGYTPERSFAAGLRATLAWYLANECWWRAVMDGSNSR
ncbi:dTDP-glucose 4,6-dehydratase [Sphingosinicella sp. BN140058]|uniref:dTDP-glucose 4,6-dehydratase n=1 Tax=Sphingosinicella sp. BN140058 TaxID=1892855 RepID=UPI00101054A0|nr:dTDP-glucose 4,6-dehydratase [Sphingosinicella sp. BN140058]QAY75714.1 dTDP-glucose 4,6-dehydratase [Sphingosinicella sp. BN140058]